MEAGVSSFEDVGEGLVNDDMERKMWAWKMRGNERIGEPP